MKIKSLLVFKGEVLGLRIEKNGKLYDTEYNKAELGILVSDSSIHRLKLIENGDLLVSEDELNTNQIIDSLDLTDTLIQEILNAYSTKAQLIIEQVESKPTPPAPTVPTEPKSEGKPSSPKNPTSKKAKTVESPKSGSKAGAKNGTKEKVYTVLLGISELADDKKTVITREVKRDFTSTSITSVKMKARNELAEELSIPLRDIRVIKAGLAR